MFEDAYAQEGRDLIVAAAEGELAPVWHRDELIAEVRELLSRRRSVLLVGPPGVGKTAIVHGLARSLHQEPGQELMAFSTIRILSGTKYLGEWQTKVMSIVSTAVADDAVLYISDVLNLATAGRTSNTDANLLDALRPSVLAGEAVLLGEVSPEELRALERNRGFSALFEKVHVAPLSSEHVRGVLERTAARTSTVLDAPTLNSLTALTGRFLPARSQPGPALQLFERAQHYRAEKAQLGEQVPLDVELVERVFSIYSGLPLFIVSRSATRRVQEIRAWFQERLVGQEQAIEAVIETIALFKAGLFDPGRPLGTFLFVGPTGVGKTELARRLAEYLFGSASRLLRFDLSEFKDFHSFELLVGNAREPDQPARLLDPVRAQPFQVILFDELEKAHDNIYDLLLPLLDEGRVTPPTGGPVDFRNTIVICTSNVGAKDADTKALGFGEAQTDRGHAFRKALEAEFRPEFLNRFQHICVFQPLTGDQVKRIFRQELRRVLQREGITRRDLVVDVDEAAVDLVIERGYDVRYGARGLKREIQRQVVMPLALSIMERGAEPGQILRVVARDGHLRVRTVDTELSREGRKERAPVQVRGKKLDRAELGEWINKLAGGVRALCESAQEVELLARHTALLELREQPSFWSGPDAAHTMLELDRLQRVLGRLDRLRAEGEALRVGFDTARARAELSSLGHRSGRLQSDLARAVRELTTMPACAHYDALVEVSPIGPGGVMARDLLVKTYAAWAAHKRGDLQWIRAPLQDDEPALIVVRAGYAAGYLHHESGLHRLRSEQQRSVARVRTGPWSEAEHDPVFGAHQALKRQSELGGRVRSRVEVQGGLVVQCERTLADARVLAREVLGSWLTLGEGVDEVVRRYDLDQPLVRDTRTGLSVGHRDALSGERFHHMLCQGFDDPA